MSIYYRVLEIWEDFQLSILWPVTFETFDQSDEETWHEQNNLCYLTLDSIRNSCDVFLYPSLRNFIDTPRRHLHHCPHLNHHCLHLYHHCSPSKCTTATMTHISNPNCSFLSLSFWESKYKSYHLLFLLWSQTFIIFTVKSKYEICIFSTEES